MSIKLTKKYFSGSGRVFAASPDGLAAILRSLAQDVAATRMQLALAASAPAQADITFTDNSTGAAAMVIVDLPLPAAASTIAAGATGATLTALNTALGKTAAAHCILGKLVNKVRDVIGLPAITYTSAILGGTAGTVAAQDKNVAGTNGVACADFVSASTVFAVVKQDFNTLVHAVNETLVALGLTAIPSTLDAALDQTGNIATVANITAAGAGGTDALLKSDADAFLLASANNIATIAALWNTQSGTIVGLVPSVHASAIG